MSVEGQKKIFTKKKKSVERSRETNNVEAILRSLPPPAPTKPRPEKKKRLPSRRPSANGTARRASREQPSAEQQSNNIPEEEDESERKMAMAVMEAADGKKYAVTAKFRGRSPNSEFYVKNSGEAYILRFEPASKAKLKYASEIIKKMNSDGSSKKMLQMICYGVNSQLNMNYLITSPYGIQLGEVLKITDGFTRPCTWNVALQCLEAIEQCHRAGFINRNIKPGTFSIGYGANEATVLLTDFRLTRTHLEKDAPRAARPTVKYCGTARYASLAALKDQDQGRKDDLESWLYMLFELLDPADGLSWRKLPRGQELIREKEYFKAHANPAAYNKVPKGLKKLVDLIHGYSYADRPDYSTISVTISTVANELGDPEVYDSANVDWIGKITAKTQRKAIREAACRSTGNRCSGEDDFEFAKPKKPERLRMKFGDAIKNDRFRWKVVCLLGSGGFGDVYKVVDETNDTKQYALKTEGDEGRKAMMRLKVEMQILMAISEAKKKKKAGSLKHFVDFVDRGRSDELKCKYIVMSLVGPSLDDCRKKFLVPLDHDKTPYIIAIQSLEAVRDLHSLGFIHRDIKPANFAVGIGPEEPTVFMLDFGIGRSFLDPKTGKHRAPRRTVKFLGTLRFASRACMLCQDQGRKDDLECWLYMIFDIFDPISGIPWKELKNRESILQTKQYFFEEKIDNIVFARVPIKFQEFIPIIRGLQYESDPDYEALINLLMLVQQSYKKQGANDEKLEMDGGNWVGKLVRPPSKRSRKKKKEEESDEKPKEKTQLTGSDYDP